MSLQYIQVLLERHFILAISQDEGTIEYELENFFIRGSQINLCMSRPKKLLDMVIALFL